MLIRITHWNWTMSLSWIQIYFILLRVTLFFIAELAEVIRLRGLLLTKVQTIVIQENWPIDLIIFFIYSKLFKVLALNISWLLIPILRGVYECSLLLASVYLLILTTWERSAVQLLRWVNHRISYSILIHMAITTKILHFWELLYIIV